MTTALMVRPPEVVEGEIVGSGVFLEENPFRIGSFRWIDVPEGAKLDRYAAAACEHLAHAYHPHVELWIDEERIERGYWPQITPKAGHTVYARIRPHSGKTGKNVLRAALMIAVVVAATVLFAPGGPIFGMGLLAAAGSAAAIAVTTTLAMLAINALIPAPGLTGEAGKQKPMLAGSSNQATPYAPVPRVFGKIRLFPVLAGHPYTEIVGKKEYLRMLLLVGWGPIKVSDIRIGNTPITAFRNVEYEITEGGPSGWSGNANITLYNRTVAEVPLSIELLYNVASVLQTTPINTIEVSVDVAFPYGLVAVDKSGNRNQETVQIKVEYCAHGTNAWAAAPLETAYNDSNQTVGGNTITVKGNSLDTALANARFKVTAGQYDVRLTRLTVDASNGGSGTQHVNRSFWTVFRTFTPDTPVVQSGVCLIAIRMQASDQLNGVPNQISCIAEAYQPVYGIGAEMVTSGDGTAVTGWTNGNSATASATGGRLRVTNGAAANGYASQSLTVVSGHRYRIGYDKFQGTATDARFKVGTAVNDGTYLNDGSTGDLTGAYTVVTATGTTMVITVEAEGAAAKYSEFDNISVKDLDANTAWSFQITRSPAWAFADVLRRRAGQTFIADSRIDIAGLSAWNAACGALAPNANEPKWSYDAVVVGGTIFDALKQIAAAGRAAYTMRDGLFGIVQDKQQATPVQIITPKNSWGYQGSRTYLQQPDAYRVEFFNAAKDYARDEVIVYADGKNAGNASIFEVMELPGCTSATQAWREGRYHIAVANLRPEEHRVHMDIEGLRCTMGDRVQLAHDVMVVGQCWGRIVSLITSGANTIGFVLDNDTVFDGTSAYQLRTRNAAGTITLRTVTVGSNSTTVNCTAEVTAGGTAPGDMYIFGVSGVESAPMIVKKIEPADDLAVMLTLSNYDDNIYPADTGAIPAFTSYITTDLDHMQPLDPTVTVRSDGTVHEAVTDHWVLQKLGVDITNPSSIVQIAGNEVQYRELYSLDWKPGGIYQPGAQTIYCTPVLNGHTYQVRARAKGLNGLYSNWVQPADTVVIGSSVAPLQPTSASVTAEYRSNIIRWTNPTDLDLEFVEVLASQTNSVGTATVVGRSITGEWTHQNLAGGAVWYYWLVAVDFAGNTSSPQLYAGTGTAQTIALYEGIGADNVLTPAEKQLIIREWTQLTNEKANIDTQATNFGVTTEKTNYDNAYSTLSTYLTGLSPAYNDTTQNTSIVRTTWNTNWSALYSNRQTLLNKIDTTASTMANWPTVTDTDGSMPDPNATGGDTAVPDSGFERGSGLIFGTLWAHSGGFNRVTA